MLRRSLLAASVLLPLLPARAADPTRGDEPESGMRARIERYEADHEALARLHDLELSPARRARLREFHAGRLAELARVDFERLDQAGRVDYVLLRNHLEHELKRLEVEAARFEEAAPLLAFAPAIVALVDARRGMEPVDAETAAGALVELKRGIERVREEIEAFEKSEQEEGGDPFVARAVANRAAGTLDDLRGALREWFRYHDGYDPLFSWWAREPYGEAEKALGDLAALVRKELVGIEESDSDAIVGDPIGREALLAELAYELIPYTPEELIAIAEREYAWCEQQMLAAARELGCGDDWHAAMEHVKDQHVAPGEQPALIRELALEAVRFLEERELVTIPPLCAETWRMAMMSPARQKVNPFFLGGETIIVSFPTDAMSHEDKRMSLRSNNVHFCRATVQHELIPGHHLQGFMARRHRPYRGLFRTPFLVEGWALWWELHLWDLGFARGPEDRLGMLFWRAHRCARIITSLGFHLGTMETDEMIEHLVERVGHERSSAEGEVRRWVRGDYGPLYQCAYLLGGLQLRALHAELVGGGTMSEREFHDAVLREGPIPIELVRASLTGAAITRDHRASWRFQGDPQ